MTSPLMDVYVLWSCLLALAPAGNESPATVTPPPPAAELRGVYLKMGESAAARGPLVGRLAVKYGEDTVPLDRAFHEGDEIKLEVSSNQAGWVFVFHQGPAGGTKLLWPDPRRPADNRLSAGITRLIPDDGVIAFDPETGQETFFVVISPVSNRPELGPGSVVTFTSSHHPRKAQTAGANGVASPVAPTPAAKDQRQKQIFVRSPVQQIQTDLDAGVRGVSFRPSDGDRYVYFTVDAHGARRWAMAHFRLQHVSASPSGAASPH